MVAIASHDDYVEQSAQSLKDTVVELRSQLQQILPDADEIIAYNMPGFKIGSATIVGYSAFTKQCGIYLHPNAITKNLDEIVGARLEYTKTGIKFTPNKPIPKALLKKLVLSSRKSYGC